MTKKQTVSPETKSRQLLMTAIASAIKSSAEIGEELHKITVQIAQHAESFGDATPALELYKGLHKSQRRKAIAEALKTYTQIRILDRKDGIKVKLDRSAKWDMDGLKANPFYDLDENKVGRPMGAIDVVKMLQGKLDSLVKRIQEWEAAPDETAKILIFKPGVDPIAEREKLQAAIVAVQRTPAAA